MKINRLLTASLATLVGCAGIYAATVTVTMNTVSTTMTLAPKGSDTNVEVGEPTSRVYTFEAPAGDYVLTAYATDGTTVNGTLELTVGEEDAEFKVLTCTAYASNKDSDGNAWSQENGDYTLSVQVNSRDGAGRTMTTGSSTTANRYTFLALSGDSYNAQFTPSEAHQSEGYGTLYKVGTLTANVNVYGSIPLMEDYSITVPADAELQLGMKFVHFIDFTLLNPKSVEASGDNKVVTYRLAQGQVYNYRTWREGGITQAGYFTMAADATKRPALSFTAEDYKAYDPHQVNHDVQSNNGYETGDIFVNINKEGHLDLNVGDTFKAHAMRSWELTDNSTNNYFMEPDFHYTILGLDGKPSDDVITVSQNAGSAWADIKAVGAGTAIVLVGYDGIRCNYYSNADKKEILGGEHWGAIWPENTAAYVVTVGQGATGVTPEFKVNEGMNDPTKKLAGDAVDAEHDVFYYLAATEGYPLTFRAEGAADVTVAYPTIGERTATYTGFSAEGITKHEDGSYTVILKEGRQIVRMADASGKAVYQVLTAKTCQYELTHVSRPGSTRFQPGDQFKIQYTGLRHPANKMAGIYNMSGYVTYNDTPNGTALILGSGQYTFGSTPSAQAVTVTIPEDYDVDANPSYLLSEGVIQINGFGDPIGNHRATDPVAGRSPNFTAISHKTYFGSIPDISIQLTPAFVFDIAVACNAAGATVEVTHNGNVLSADESGHYSGSYGDYAVVAKAAGYCCYRATFTLGEEDREASQTFRVEMEQVEGAWDGTTRAEPTVNADGQYVIATAAELAWYADHVNAAGENHNAILVADIHLGNYDWSPIGTASATSLNGTLTGGGHRIDGVYVNSTASNVGLVGYAKGTADAPIAITGITVSGSITAKSNVGGVVGYMTSYVTVDTCANYASVASTNSSGVAGGVVGYKSSNCYIANCYNAGSVSSTGYHGGILGNGASETTIANVFNVGDVEDNAKANACFGAAGSSLAIATAYATADLTNAYGYTLVTDAQMASGEIAYLLSDAFGQELGKDPYPVFGGPKVYYDNDNGCYTNITTGIATIAADRQAAVGYYNLQGIRSASPWPGVNVVRLADGSVRKVLVR